MQTLTIMCSTIPQLDIKKTKLYFFDCAADLLAEKPEAWHLRGT